MLIDAASRAWAAAMVSRAAPSIILTTVRGGQRAQTRVAVLGCDRRRPAARSPPARGRCPGLRWRWVSSSTCRSGPRSSCWRRGIVPESRGEGARRLRVGGGDGIRWNEGPAVFTLIQANDWAGGGATLAGLAVSAVMLVGFRVIERRHENPLYRLRIFSNAARGRRRDDAALCAARRRVFF